MKGLGFREGELLKKVKTFFTNTSLFAKITVIFIFITVLSITVTSLVIINILSNTIEKKEILLDSIAMKEITNYTQEKYNRVYDLLNYMESSNNIGELMARVKNNPEAAYQYDTIKFINNSLSAILASDSDFMDTILITTNGVFYSDTKTKGRTISVSYDYLHQKEINDFLKSDQAIAEISDKPKYVENSEVPVITFLTKIYDPSKYPKRSVVGVFLFNIGADSFRSKFRDYSSNLRGSLTLVNSSDQILFSFSPDNWGQHYNRILQEPKDSVMDSMKVGLSGMTVIDVVSPSILQSELNEIKQNLFFLIVLIVLFNIVITMLIFRLFNNRIQTLVHYMEKVQDGSLNSRIPIKSRDEIGKLSVSFNQMCDKLQDYINRVYYAEINQKNAELSMLQAQINPHFLFNTLETIRMKAHNDGNEELASMTALLGALFRWNVKSSSRIIATAEELDYIKTYLEIEQFRSPGGFEYEIDVPNEILGMGIPKLILQPLVENVFSHGFEGKMQDCMLVIGGRLCGNAVELWVADNGAGMDEQTRKKLEIEMNRPPSESDHSHIGIINVHQRLSLIFGDGYGVKIDSGNTAGTMVTVRFPALSVKEMKRLCGEL